MEAIGVPIASANQCSAWHAVGNTIGYCHFIELSNGPVASLRNRHWHWYDIYLRHYGSPFDNKQIGYKLYLGHNGHQCSKANEEEIIPTAGPHHPQGPLHKGNEGTLSDDDQAWVDTDGIPLHLHPPSSSDYLTIVDISGIHFLTIRYCHCSGADDHYLQLLSSKLFPATIRKPRTVFTFRVLDDFIRDNLECGTSGMNYFSKLRRITSNVFPHAVPVCMNVHG